MRGRPDRRALVRWAFAMCILPLACTLAAGEPPHPRATAALRVAVCTERILKLQAQLGQRVLLPRTRRALPQSVRAFDASVRALGVPAAPSELHESAAILALLARQYRGWALKPATPDNARSLGERAEELAWEAAKVARLLSPPAPGQPRPAAAIALEGSELAQRVARLLFWRRWEVGGDSIGNELALAQAALAADLEALRARGAADSRIDSELEVAENQVGFLLASARRIERGNAEAHDLEFAAKASDNAAESLDHLATLYESPGPARD